MFFLPLGIMSIDKMASIRGVGRGDMNVILTEKSLTLYFPNYSRPAILSAISIKHLIDLRIISQFVLAANQNSPQNPITICSWSYLDNLRIKWQITQQALSYTVIKFMVYYTIIFERMFIQTFFYFDIQIHTTFVC